jgi:SAM-dependent methyltransferase
MPPTDNKLTTPEQITAAARAFTQSRLVLSAIELGVFSIVGDGPCSSGEVAVAISADPRATDRLLNALCGIGLLAKTDGRFANTPLAARYLVRQSPDYLASLEHSAQMWDTWSTLTEAVRAGRSVVDRDTGDGWAEQRRRVFIGAMHHRATAQAEDVAERIGLAGVKRVLDVGGGSGAFSVAFAAAQPDLKATVFDRPEIVPITREYVAEGGYADRIDTHEGDYNEDPLPGGNDLVFLSAIVHIENDEGNRALVRKSADALRPGGRVVISDFIMDEDRVSPPHGATFALNMLVATVRGDTFTESEVRAWFAQAGLVEPERVDTPWGATLMIARKP